MIKYLNVYFFISRRLKTVEFVMKKKKLNKGIDLIFWKYDGGCFRGFKYKSQWAGNWKYRGYQMEHSTTALLNVRQLTLFFNKATKQ